MKNPYEVIKIDKYTGKIQSPTLLLMNRSFNIIGKISRYENWNISLVANGMDEISFEVHKYADGKLCPVWDDLIDLKIVNVKNFGYFEISVDYTDNTETVKSIHGTSLETELAQASLYEFHVNDNESADMEITEYSKDNYKDGNFIPTVFYNPDDEKHSLLHRVLADKAPHWSIGKVPAYIILDEENKPESSSSFQRTYTVDGDSIYDFLTGTVAEESNVVFTFDVEAKEDENGNIIYQRVINCYNLCDYIDPNTGIGLGSPIGEDTTVLVSKRKLANEITISSNKDNVKNCFRIEGGDDVITDMVRAVNMNGSNYIYQFADFQYNDMSEELRQEIIEYQQIMSSQKTQDEYYGYGDIDSFLNGNLILRMMSELDAAAIMNICGNNKVKTENVSIYDHAKTPYWYITVSNDNKVLHVSKTVTKEYKTASMAINTMGIYSKLCNAYDELAYFESSMMPNTDKVLDIGEAKAQYDKVFAALNHSTVAVSSMNNYNNNLFVGVTNNVEAYAQIFLDSRFDLEIVSGTTSYSYTNGAETGTWKGKIRITQHTDEKNVYPVDISTVSPIEVTVNANELEFAKQKIQKELSSGSMLDIDFNVAEMSDEDMRNYFNQYSLNRLTSFYDGYNSCISILTTLGQTTDSDVRNEIYDTYYKRMEIVEEIKNIRQAQVDEIKEKIKNLQEEQRIFQYGGEYEGKHYEPHDFRTYLGNDDLYKEFCAYRREDTYSNSNYVSDGLPTAECLAKAKELVEVATKEAKKACVLQRTVSTSLNNLFALPEFEPLYDKFALFNYIRIRTEDEILKLRLIGIDFSGDSVEEIQVTFSEQIESVDGTMSDLQSIIQQAGNMATSYPSTALQAKQGSEARNAVLEMYTSGLNAAKTMLTNNDSNEVTITPSGIICRRMDDEGFYGDKQIRITGNIMAFTRDNWKSVAMAIGETTFKDPITGNDKQKYGIIAENLVGKLIAGESAYIGNEKGSVLITGDGIKIDRGTITWGSDNVNAPEMGDISGLTEFKNKVNIALTGSTTEIGSDYVISPKIGGGYLFIEDNREIDNTGISVEINPNGTAGFTEHNGNYVFNISKEENNSTKLIMGVKNNGDGYFSGEITAESGSIGGWNINNGTLSSSGTGGEISLNSGGNSIYSISGNNKAILTSGYLGFEKNDKKYVTLHTTFWKDKPNVYGVGINSEADSKFISFGNKKSPEEESYTTPLVLNYGLDPNEDKQDVLVYGSTLITGETTIKNKLYFNDNFYLDSWNKNGNLSGIGCNGDFSTIGNINAGNIDYGCRLNVDGSAYVNGSISTSNGDVSLDGHNLWTHAITWSDNDNARTDKNNKSTDLNLASVRWVRNNFTRKDSDERVKCNFTSLPNQIDEIFDAFSPRQYEYKEGLEKTGFHFGDTAQHIESVFAENNLNPSDYAITGERRVDMEGKEKDYITNDTFHYIDQNNIIWLCVDQIQKLKKREKAVPDMLKLIQEQKEEIDALNSRIFALEQENKDFRHKLENLEEKISSLK